MDMFCGDNRDSSEKFLKKKFHKNVDNSNDV
ncbi:hypothetical protein T4A_12831 [Trichinella pseudospiralis]|uniref:Uncharacterized protein n=1 Tax=Trichinella pseudospiralis TaxID=6337 RepID=A0A0V1AKK6_TRIPS|nr:hypothetical protein T4A_12831 [Trichinella pseudospiralis]